LIVEHELQGLVYKDASFSGRLLQLKEWN